MVFLVDIDTLTSNLGIHCFIQVVVQTEDIDLAGEVVQDAAAYLGLTELESIASFPSLMQSFHSVLVKVTALYTPVLFWLSCSFAWSVHAGSIIVTKLGKA